MKIYYLYIPFSIRLIVQVLKLGVDIRRKKDVKMYDFLLVGGGFPSAHASLTSSVVMLVWLQEGSDSLLFVVSLIFAILLWYDAMNVRYQAGKHARRLNQLTTQLSSIDKQMVEKEIEHFEERLGHTWWEVVGGIVLGSALSFLMYYLFFV